MEIDLSSSVEYSGGTSEIQISRGNLNSLQGACYPCLIVAVPTCAIDVDRETTGSPSHSAVPRLKYGRDICA